MGELWIGGDGLARGYLGRAALTAERFMPNPFGSPGGRLYRSGDLGRIRADGNLEFEGRADRQVKIRGYRVELGEIETVLAEHPAVRGAAVLALESTTGDQRLAAYFVAAQGISPATAELRQHLRERLPSYMVPTAIIALADLPLTANGKLDRTRLPPPRWATSSRPLR